MTPDPSEAARREWAVPAGADLTVDQAIEALGELDERSQAGEEIPVHSVSLLLSFGKEYRGTIASAGGRHVWLRLAGTSSDVLLTPREAVSGIIVHEPEVLGPYLFEHVKVVPEVPPLTLLHLKNLARDAESRLKNASACLGPSASPRRCPRALGRALCCLKASRIWYGPSSA